MLCVVDRWIAVRLHLFPMSPFIAMKTEVILNDKIELHKPARDFARWMILRMLYAARPGRVSDTIILRVLQTFDFDCGLDDVRQALDYMRSVGLAEAARDELTGCWARLTVMGVAVVEYDVRSPSGIGRPRKRRNSKR
jgi:hypothetical protein